MKELSYIDMFLIHHKYKCDHYKCDRVIFCSLYWDQVASALERPPGGPVTAPQEVTETTSLQFLCLFSQNDTRQVVPEVTQA